MIHIKKALLKTLAVSVCAALAAGGAYALAPEKPADTEKVTKETTSVAAASEDTGAVKDETVYVLAGADGSVQKIIVSDWLKNTLGAQQLSDSTTLSDIENVKGDESFASGSWDAQGNDIYYQGNSDQELPVSMKVTYKLDGKEISPQELLGKSGKVTIRFDYTNNSYETVEIGGKQEKIYVPFVMLTGMLLDNEVFRNVEVTNGKLINDGSRSAVVGMAFPSLQENLAIDKEQFEIPDFLEITADVSDFAFGMTITVATNEPFSKLDIEALGDMTDLDSSMQEMTDAMDQLLDGSAQLYDGLETLLEKAGELSEGVDKLAAGSQELKNGCDTLNGGAGTLQSGAQQLSDGLNTLSANNDTLNGGAKQVFETLLSTADTQIAAAGLDVQKLTIENYAKVLDEVITSLDTNAVYQQALDTVTKAVEEQRGYITQQVTAAVKQQVTEQVTAAVKQQVSEKVTAAVRETVRAAVLKNALNMDTESYDKAVAAGMIDSATAAQINAAVDQQMQSKDVQQQIQSNITAQMNTQEIQSTIAANTDAQMKTAAVKKTISDNVEAQVKKAVSENMASDEVQKTLAAASEGAKSLIALKSSLDSYNTFYLGLQTYTKGVSDAAVGAAALKSGSSDLKAGTQKLCSGAEELNNGVLALKGSVPALIEGVTKLRDGAQQLSDGLKQFNSEGIQKLVSAIDGDLSGLTERLKATVSVSQRYNNFSGIESGMSGQVRFIYRTEGIEGNSEE